MNCFLQLEDEVFIMYGYCLGLGLDCERSTRSDMPLILHLGMEATYLGNLLLLNSSLGMAFTEASLGNNRHETLKRVL
jgi:hypothetical protein